MANGNNGHQLQLIEGGKRTEYPKVRDTVRPFRLWNPQANPPRNVPHRYYATERRALDAALLLVRWEKVGTTFEVYDCRRQHFIASYSRRVNTIAFTSYEVVK